MGGAQSQMLGGNSALMPALSPVEEADLDAALIDTYAKAGITQDPLTHGSPPPTIADLYDTLMHMGGTGPQLAQRLRKYTPHYSRASLASQAISISAIPSLSLTSATSRMNSDLSPCTLC